MKKNVVVLEAEGGNDKWIDGHRRDTMPIVDAMIKKGYGAEVLYFRDDWADELFQYILEHYDAVIVRINPGTLPNGEAKLFEVLRKLDDSDVLILTHPNTMMHFGAKDALSKLADTELVPDDTYAYYTVEDFEKNFPKSISYGTRVLKQNRGSTGEGIWRVEIVDSKLGEYEPGDTLPLDTVIKCTEAVDNHVEYSSLGKFMNFCHRYIEGDNGMLVDMRFMPRIVEGEIRILMVGDEPIFAVHKKPAQDKDAFSATIGSGAEYTYYKPDEYPELIDKFCSSIPTISDKLGKINTPIIWTGDFMLDTDEDGNDSFVLGEMNCSCVGFFSHLDMGIQEKVADEVIRRVEIKNVAVA